MASIVHKRMRPQAQTTVRPGHRIAALGIAALAVALTGCGGDGSSEGKSLNSTDPIRDQVRNVAMGPDGRIQIPLDYVDESGRSPRIEEGDAPSASGRGRVTEIADEVEFRVECPDLAGTLHYQQHPQWCWAAAVQTAEHYQAGAGYTTDQVAIVKRVYPNPDQVQNQTALSFQIAQALASPHERTNDAASIGLAESSRLAPTLSTLQDALEVRQMSSLSDDAVIRYLDQFIGTQELVASLSRGEPVLVSLAEPSDAEPLRHIYVIQGVDVVSIDRGDSREVKLRRANALAKETRKRGGVDGDFADDVRDFSGESFSAVKGFFTGSDVYALKKIYLLDPWKDAGAHDPVGAPQVVTLTGREFADRAFFMINRTTADQIMAEHRATRNQAGQTIDQNLNRPLPIPQ